MADFDPILRLIRQDYGENPDAWGGQLNAGAITRTGEAFTIVAVTVNADVTLTVENGLADQARRLGFILSGAGGFTVTHPAIPKPYLLINNCAADITFKPQGGTGATIRTGTKVWYYTNETGTIGYALDYRISDFLAANKNIDMGGFAIKNIAPGVDPADVATLAQLAPYATAAANSAAAAANSATNAANSASSTLTLYNDFQKRYLGAKTSDPTTDNLGNALTAGALYFNNASLPGTLRVYNGSNWVVIPTFTLSTQAQAEAGTDNTTIMTPLRVAQAIAALATGYQEFLSNGTWTKPASAKWVFVEVLGAGGGGGSGRRGAISTFKAGGAAGGGATAITGMFAASDLTTSVAIIIGAVGAGGAAITVNDTNGNNGTDGGTSSFGAYLSSIGGKAGAGGGTSGTVGGAGASWYAVASSSAPVSFEGGNAGVPALYGGGGGGSSSAGTGAGSLGGSSVFGRPGGGGGAGESSGNALATAAAGGAFRSMGTGGGGAAGISSAGAPTAGANGTGGAGGGGGGASQTVAAANGGNGDLGAGGGGGGSSRNGFNSGKGGDGGAGRVRVWWG